MLCGECATFSCFAPSRTKGHRTCQYATRSTCSLLHVRAGSSETTEIISPRMPLHYVLECHIFSITLTAMNRGRGWHGQCFCSGPRTGDSGENVSPPTTGLQKGQYWSGVSVGKHHFFLFFFMNEPIASTVGHAFKKCRGNVRRSDCVGLILSNIYRPKLIPYWN